MKLDVGSGYNPLRGFKTCDNAVYADYRSIEEVETNSVDVLNCSNTLHHVENLNHMIQEFNRVTKDDGFCIVSECRKEDFKVNLFLDILWYHFILNRRDIYVSREYREYESIFLNNGFKLVFHLERNEKELKLFKKEVPDDGTNKSSIRG